MLNEQIHLWHPSLEMTALQGEQDAGSMSFGHGGVSDDWVAGSEVELGTGNPGVTGYDGVVTMGLYGCTVTFVLLMKGGLVV